MINKEILLIPLKGTFQICHQSRIEKGQIWLSPLISIRCQTVCAVEIWIFFYFNQQGLCHRISDQVTTSIWSFFLLQKALKACNRLALPILLRSPPSASGHLKQLLDTSLCYLNLKVMKCFLESAPGFTAVLCPTILQHHPLPADNYHRGPPSALESKVCSSVCLRHRVFEK